MVARDEFDSGTRDLLMGTRTDARESFYRTSAPKMLLSVAAVILSLSMGLLGAVIEKPLGYIAVFAGVMGLSLVAFWHSDLIG